MRIGIYGGTFDPVHLGHLLLAESARQAARLDRVLFIPAGRSPFKPDAQLSTAKQRIDMLELATAGCPEFIIDKRETKRDGLTYTVDTLQELKSEYPDDELFLLMGADSIQDFPQWKSPQLITELATLVAVNRPETPLPDLQQLSISWGFDPTNRILITSMPAIGISATDLRHRASTGQSLRFQTPRPVEHYIQNHKLYHPTTS